MPHSKKNFTNTRKYTRSVRAEITATIVRFNLLGIKEKIACNLIDISAGGIQATTSEKLTVKNKHQIILTFANGDQFKIKADVAWQVEAMHHFSRHSFMMTKDFLNNPDNPLRTVQLMDKDKKEIDAKYRFLSQHSIQFLTYAPLNPKTQYKLNFTLKNGKSINVIPQTDKFKQQSFNRYGFQFSRTNDELAEYLLNTQTELVFR